VQQGEVLGVIGKNGAGKSTLLKILSKITSPTTGSIKSKGRVASLLEVGTGFHGEMTGRENIFLNGAILGMTKKEITDKLDEIIEFSGCERYIDTPVKRYSSGMTVRLAFAVAAFLEPDILIVDEVLAVGDAEFQKKAIGKMKDISRSGERTVLFVSHNMAAVKNLCTRGIVLENGGVVFDGETDEAVNYYLKSGKPISDLNLLDRPDRLGNGKLKIKDLKFFNREGNEIYAILSGDEIHVVVYLEKYQIVNYEKLIVSIAFLDNDENTLLLFSSDEIRSKVDNFNSSNSIKLRIPNLYLRGGLYSLRIVITEGSTRTEDFIDVLENVAKIEILQTDLFGIGKANRNLNQVILPGTYEI
jgi:lipopolysaccharide transport system ATP-binding protein